MKIKGELLKDELVMEIGKFAILWNCFERFQCNNNCSPKEIKRIAPFLNVDVKYQAQLAEVLNQRRSWFGQVISEYVETGLCPGNAKPSIEEDKHLMEQSDDDLRAGCLLVIYRIRNNLMHGLKCIEQLNDQLELFQAVNCVLEAIE